MNKTMLLALLTKCKDVMSEEQDNHEFFLSLNVTTVTPSHSAVTNSSRKSYDNAYFYILFVMFIYSFLALTLVRSFLQNEKMMKDQYEDSRNSADATEHKYSEGSTSGNFYFGDETII
ncbi:potassium voltage-gated channel subfamily E member 3-like [Tachysurus ichikawai]